MTPGRLAVWFAWLCAVGLSTLALAPIVAVVTGSLATDTAITEAREGALSVDDSCPSSVAALPTVNLTFPVAHCRGAEVTPLSSGAIARTVGACGVRAPPSASSFGRS
jgi:hypothetical protein